MSDVVKFSDIFSKGEVADHMTMIEYVLRSNPTDFKNFPTAYRTEEISKMAVKYGKFNVEFIDPEFVDEEMVISIIQSLNQDFVCKIPKRHLVVKYVKEHLSVRNIALLSGDEYNDDILTYLVNDIEKNNISLYDWKYKRHSDNSTSLLRSYLCHNPLGNEEIKYRLLKILDKNFNLLHFLHGCDWVDTDKFLIKHLNDKTNTSAISQVAEFLEEHNLSRKTITELILCENELYDKVIGHWRTTYGNKFDYYDLYQRGCTQPLFRKIYKKILNELSFISKVKFICNDAIYTHFNIPELNRENVK